MRYRHFYFLSVVLIGVQFSGCQGNTAKKGVTEVVNTDSTAAQPAAATKVTANRYCNDAALFIAGMENPDNAGNTIPENLRLRSKWKMFSDSMNAGFNSIEKHRLSLMRNWAKTELKEELEHPKTLFYPFSGPDILHGITFYPDADQYIMIALERPGSLPDFKTMDSSKLTFYCNSVLKSLGDIFNKSYFITRKMGGDMYKVNGVTPLLCAFLARTGHTVLDIKKYHLQQDGSGKEISPDSSANNLNDYIELYFKNNGTDKVRKITYFKTNLCDEPYEGMMSLTENKALQNYLNKLPECYTYVKSASYLMNYKSFTLIRNVCLSKSKSILQDDTGIAFQFFKKDKWKVQLYGNYVKPVSDFSGVFQNDLNEAYKDSSKVKQLPYSLGYHWAKKANQNLMKAVRL